MTLVENGLHSLANHGNAEKQNLLEDRLVPLISNTMVSHDRRRPSISISPTSLKNHCCTALVLCRCFRSESGSAEEVCNQDWTKSFQCHVDELSHNKGQLDNLSVCQDS